MSYKKLDLPDKRGVRIKNEITNELIFRKKNYDFIKRGDLIV